MQYMSDTLIEDINELRRQIELINRILGTNVTIAGTFTPRGAYDNGTDYAVGDAVSYNGSSYIMYVNAAAGTLPTDTTKWQVISNKGATGATGATGAGVPTGGSTHQILRKINGTNYNTEWVTPVNEVAVKSGSYVLAATDEVVVFTATATATLPAATGSGKSYRIINEGVGATVTIDADGSETIKGSLTQTLQQGEDLIITDYASGKWA